MNIPSLAIALALTSGCYQTRLLRPGDVPPTTARVAPDQRLAVWQTAIGVLLDDGFVPDTLDATAGYISAKARDDVNDDTLQHTRVIVRIQPDGLVRVQVSGVGQFASDEALAATVTDTQKKLFDQIMHAAAAPGAT
ncbi:MAG: hypothetical protein QM831_17190 [Kofleriaceae bacterium]